MDGIGTSSMMCFLLPIVFIRCSKTQFPIVPKHVKWCCWIVPVVFIMKKSFNFYLLGQWPEFTFSFQTQKTVIWAPRMRNTRHMNLCGFLLFLLYVHFGWIFEKIIVNQKKSKMDSIQVDLCSKHMIWYNLVRILLYY